LTNLSKVCSLPFTHLATHPNGHTSFCCISDHTNCASHAKRGGKSISLNDVSIREMHNSETYTQVRLDMLAGKEPDACKRCYDEERSGIKSKRLEENERYLASSMEVINSMNPDGHIDNMDFQFIELRLGNVCNLKCRTCNPVSSSKWVVEHAELSKELDFVTDYSNVESGVWFELDRFWGELLNNSPNLKRIYVNGGEPTLVEKHFAFLHNLIDSGRASNIDLWYNINVTNLPHELINIWGKFKSITVTASIDDLFKRNDYIRSGSQWADIVFNLSKLKLTETIDLSICQTLSIYNIFYVDKFYNFFKDYRIHHNWCYDPAFLSPWNLPDDVKKTIIDNCKSMPDYERNNIEQTLMKPRNETQFKQFIAYNRKLDLMRKTKFSDIFPELAAAINYDGQ
jgi:MoaA/NifB/PqqE/SkfB family radical SAM enzyme